MSATQAQTTIEILLLKDAESLSQLLYGKPYTELDEQRQALMMTGARRYLRTRMSFPGECCDCGVRVAEGKVNAAPVTKHSRRANGRGIAAKQRMRAG